MDRLGDRVVQLFDPIVSLLVQTIDRSFDLGDTSIGHVGIACDVFFVPELKIKSVLLANPSEPTRVRVGDGFVMPPADAIDLQSRPVLNLAGDRGKAAWIIRGATQRIKLLFRRSSSSCDAGRDRFARHRADARCDVWS